MSTAVDEMFQVALELGNKTIDVEFSSRPFVGGCSDLSKLSEASTDALGPTVYGWVWSIPSSISWPVTALLKLLLFKNEYY